MTSGWKRRVGVDEVETLLWVAGAGMTVTLMAEASRDPIVAMLTGLVCLVGFGIRRAIGLRALPAGEETSGGYRLADVEGRLAELEALHARVAELEERVDFSERLLADPAQRERIAGGKQ